jgi:flagellar biosynthesis protein FlhA
MSIGEAGQHFSLLTVGDGLSAQIPALMISVATGIIVTRTASEKDLGNDIAGQITGQKKAPLVAGVVMIVLAVVPGLPKLPFIVIGCLFLALWRSIKDNPTAAETAAEQEQLAQTQAAAELPAPKDAALEALQVDALELAIGFGLVPLVDDSAGGSLLTRVKTIRRQIASELGVVIPPVRIHDEVGLDAHEYVVKVRGAEVAQGRILAGHQLAMDPGDAVGQLQGVPTTEPAFGIPATWIPDAARAEAEALGYTVVDRESVIVTHLTETIRANAGEMLTRQDTRQLLDQLKETNAAVVEEVVPDVLQLGEVQRVLQNLLREGVSVRDLGTIVEAIGDKARVTRDPSLLAEYARQALGRAITAPHLDTERKLRAISLDPMVEQEVSDSIAQTADGEYLVMEPSRAQMLVSQLKEQVDGSLAHGGRPVLLCSARVRRHLRRLCEQALPQLPVCSYNEVMPGIRVETVGVVNA